MHFWKIFLSGTFLSQMVGGKNKVKDALQNLKKKLYSFPRRTISQK